MLLLNDLLVRPFVGLLRTLQVMALRELYDIEALRDDLKENQLLYELGERSREEYERERQRLQRELNIAEQVHEQISDRVTIKR